MKKFIAGISFVLLIFWIIPVHSQSEKDAAVMNPDAAVDPAASLDDVSQKNIVDGSSKNDVVSFRDLALKDPAQAFALIGSDVNKTLDSNSPSYPKKISLPDIVINIHALDNYIEEDQSEWTGFFGTFVQDKVTKIVYSSSFQGKYGQYKVSAFSAYQVGDLIIAGEMPGLEPLVNAEEAKKILEEKLANPADYNLLVVLVNYSDAAVGSFSKENAADWFLKGPLQEDFSARFDKKVNLAGQVVEVTLKNKPEGECSPVSLNNDNVTLDNQELVDGLVNNGVRLSEYQHLVVIGNCHDNTNVGYAGTLTLKDGSPEDLKALGAEGMDSMSFAFVGTPDGTPALELVSKEISHGLYGNNGGAFFPPPPASPACNTLYMGGGYTGGNYLADFWSFKNTWNQKSANAPWVKRWEHVSIVFQNKIWVIGGYGGNSNPTMGSLHDVWFYNGITWTHFDHDPATPGIQDAPWPFNGRAGFPAVVFNNKIWIIGGGNGAAGYNDVWTFDGVTWTHFDHDLVASGIQDAPLLPKQRHQAVVFNNKIWLMAGFFSNGTPLSEVWSFDGTPGSTWTHFDHDPATPGIQDAPWPARASSKAVVFNAKIWIMGGGQGVCYHDVWSFDGTSGSTWTQFDHDPVAPGIQDAPWSVRCGMPGAVFSGRIWIVGGAWPFTNDVWSFDGTSGSTWAHFDHDAVTPGIQDAPWGPRGMMAAAYFTAPGCPVPLDPQIQ